MSGRCIQCGRRLGARAQFLYNTTERGPVYLCGRRDCEEAYNGGPASDLGDCPCGAHPKRAA